MTSAPAARASFWQRPATWKPVLLLAGYLVFYLAVVQLVGLLFGARIDDEDVLAGPASTFFGLTLPIAVVDVKVTDCTVMKDAHPLSPQA